MDILKRNYFNKILVLWLLAFTSVATTNGAPFEDDLDVSGQFWMRWSVSDRITIENPIGGLILVDGNREKITDYVKYIETRYKNDFPVFRELSVKESIIFADDELALNAEILKTATTSTIKAYGFHIGAVLKGTGLKGCIIKADDLIDEQQQQNFESGLQKAGLIIIPDESEVSDYQLNPDEIKKPKKQFESYHQSGQLQVHHLSDAENWFVDWLNNDILIIEEDQAEALDFFSKRVNGNKWYRKIAEQKNIKSAKLIKPNIKKVS